MRTRLFSIVLLLCMLLGSAAQAEWTPQTANLAKYEETYGEASESYKRIRYGAESADIGQLKEVLAGLGYFPYRVSNNYYRTMQTAIAVFAGQMRIGGDGSEITPLMQAMLTDAANMPAAISPVIDIFSYGWEANNNSYDAYTYARITRASVREDTAVGFSGHISQAHFDAGTYYYAVQMENDPQKVVYVSYVPLPRTTVFQRGDAVSVFGITQGEQAFAYEGMDVSALVIKADRIGYEAK